MRLRVLSAVAAAAFSLCAWAASATTITVDSALDDGVGCTLRNAVATSTDNLPHGTCAVGGTSNTIQFAPALNGTPIVIGSPALNIDVNSLTILGNGPANTIVDAGGNDRIFDNFGSGAVMSITWQNMTLRNGSATAAVGGFSDAGAVFIDTNTTGTIANCAITGNFAEGSGGAVENRGALTIADTTLDGNVASGEGGAISHTGASLLISNSTISNNGAFDGGGLFHDSIGAAILIINSTFAGNTAFGGAGAHGGAISADDPTSTAALNLVQTTVANNSATTGGGLFVAQPGFTIDRSLIAQNTGPGGDDCETSGATINSLGFNFLTSTTGCTITGATVNDTVNGAAPVVGTLANNGGPEQTVAILDESPAIDTGGPSCATAADQRGVARPIGAACDPGSFEAPLPVTFTPTTLGPGQVGVAYSQTFVNGPVGTGPFTYAVVAGTLPAGMTLTAPGTLQGTPTAGGPFTFTVRIFDSTGRHGSAPLSLTILPPAIVVAPPTLPAGVFGVAYSQGITASGGTAPYTFAVTAGATPPGVPLAPGGLLAGTPNAAGTFNFTVTATDSSTGTGPFTASQAYSVTIAPVLPGAPVIGTATAGNAKATVAFTPPASDGGSAITLYTATSSPSGLTGTAAASPITVNGLTNGTSYTFTVTATNGVGIGPASAPSNAVTPTATQLITFANPGQQTLGTSPTLTASSDSGLPVTFTSSTPGVCTITPGGTLTLVVAGTCTINADQPGNATVAAAPTVTQSFAVVAKTAQTITFANPGAQAFGTTPTLTATATSGLAVTFTSTTPSVCTITPGGTLTFVAAGPCSINADQAGNATFLAAPTVTQPFTVNAVVPGAPVIGTATPGSAQATISFTAPASNGGAPITSYRATCNPGGLTATGAGSPITVTGLTNGTTYTCSVTATNSAGNSAASATVSVTPGAVVTTFSGPSPTGTGTISGSFSGGGPTCTFSVARLIPVTGDPASPPAGSAPAGVTFPEGLLLFTTTGCTPGSVITMTVTYPAALPSGTQYWKYGPTPTDPSPHWYVLPAAIGANTVTFSIADGGLGDDDLAPNGSIVDQGGPGAGGPVAGPPQVPTLSEWALLGLMALLGWAGAFRLRRR